MANSFYIGAYWGARAEPLQGVKNKILQTLKTLAEIDEQFLDWYEKGISRSQALDKKVTLNNDIIERLCLERVKKGELDERGFSKMGFLFSLWTGHQEDETSSISFSVGTNSKWLTNSCVIKIPLNGPARERLLLTENAKKIIAVLVEIWNPDYAFLTSHDLSKKLDGIGWVTYRKFIKRVPTTSSEVLYEKGNDGHWFYFRSANFDERVVGELLPVKDVI